MGFSNSKLDDDKALMLCRERKRFVQQALDGRCLLAAAHVSYIQSLRSTGTALRKFVEPESVSESSLYTSSANSHPNGLTDRSLSHMSCSSPALSRRMDHAEGLSPSPSPPSSEWFHVRYVKSGGTPATTVKERLPVSVITMEPSPLSTSHDHDSEFPLGTPPASQTPPWDYFSLPRPPNCCSLTDDIQKEASESADGMHYIKSLEKENVHDPGNDGEKGCITEGSEESSDFEDDFDDHSSISLVRRYQKQDQASHLSVALDSNLQDGEVDESQHQLKEDEGVHGGSLSDAGQKVMPDDTNSEHAPSAGLSSLVIGTVSAREPCSRNEHDSKDLLSTMKEIENLFVKISESGQEVPRMLEASKLHLHPIFPESKVPRSWRAKFLSACFTCLEEPAEVPNEAPPTGMKYLTWQRSGSSVSSSSINAVGSASKDEILDNTISLFSNVCMNSGSHASTLDRLYAWEKKLYDEVKASGIIRREYDLKCKLLRQQDSRGEHTLKIDKTRATVKDLHSRIRVAIQRIDSVSRQIEQLRDKELQPQLEELMEGLKRMWEMMLQSHRDQFSIISRVSSNVTPRISVHSESHRQAALLLDSELHSLCSRFLNWVETQKSYLQAINSWLLKCVLFVRKKSSTRRNREFCPWRTLAPPIYVICDEWLKKLDELPNKDVEHGIDQLQVVIAQHLPRKNRSDQSKLPSVLSWKEGGSGEVTSEARDEYAQCSFEGFHPSLVVFFKRLNEFADVSVQKYSELFLDVKKFTQSYEMV